MTGAHPPRSLFERPAEPTEPRSHGWFLRHVTKIAVAGGLLLFVDSRTTNLVVAEIDHAFDHAREDDTPEAWRRYVEEGGRRDKASVELARLHDGTRARLRDAGAPRPDGLDPLLERLLPAIDSRIYLLAEPLQVDRGSFAALPAAEIAGAQLVPVGEQLVASDYVCASHISDAFAAATGDETIEVTTPDSFDADPTPGAPTIHLSWTASASGTIYSSGTDKRLFPGFTITATLRLVAADTELAQFEATVDPGTSFEYTTDALGAGFGLDQADVISGMVGAACRSLGDRLVHELTGWAPAVGSRDGGRGTATEECARMDAQACLLAAEPLRESDPKQALELLKTGCNSPGLHAGDACVAGAELALTHPDDPFSVGSESRSLLSTGCNAHHALACARLAELQLEPWLDEPAPSELAKREAYVLRLRACDLRDAAACSAAADQARTGNGQAREKPSPVRAAILQARACRAGDATACGSDEPTEREPIFGVELGRGDRVFDVRWGMWFENDETEVVWIASSDPKSSIAARVSELATGRVRTYDPAALPPGPIAPTDARSVFAIVGEPDGDGQCPECTAEAATNRFWPIFCTCLPQ